VIVTGRKIGKYEDVPKLTVTDSAGNELASAQAQTIGDVITATFTATEIGPYALKIDAGRNPCRPRARSCCCPQAPVGRRCTG